MSFRDKDQADFDLERFIDMFDEAINSKDPRVISALRSLMMVVTLTRPETNHNDSNDRNPGPLRRLFEDVNHLNRRLGRMEDEFLSFQRQTTEAYFRRNPDYPYEKYVLKASMDMAAQIDQNVLQRLKAQTATAQIKGLK